VGSVVEDAMEYLRELLAAELLYRNVASAAVPLCQGRGILIACSLSWVSGTEVVGNYGFEDAGIAVLPRRRRLHQCTILFDRRACAVLLAGFQDRKALAYADQNDVSSDETSRPMALTVM